VRMTVRVIDVNDNSPMLLNPWGDRIVSFSEGQASGTAVTTLYAYDADANSVLGYRISGALRFFPPLIESPTGADDRVNLGFSVNLISGVVTSVGVFDSESTVVAAYQLNASGVYRYTVGMTIAITDGA
jgi:hypothetical protein